MSSSVSTATTSSPSSTSTDTNTGGGSILSSQASLYLYTFLVTLILLLSVSGAIVVRSYIMRRRHARLVEEAIRNGTYVPPDPPKKKKPLGEKPVLYDAYLEGGDARWAFSGGPEKSRDIMMSASESLYWEEFRPLSVMLLSPSPSAQEREESQTQGSASTPGIAPHEPRRWRPLRFVHLPAIISDRLRMSAAPITTSQTSPSALSPTALSKQAENLPKDDMTAIPTIARMAVVIAMPSPPLPAPHSSKTNSRPLSVPIPGGTMTVQPPIESSEELPYIEFGVADVILRNSDDADNVSERKA